MQRLYFVNKGIISLMDLSTMGDSVKRDDSSKIGTYDSGLKYAISILLRHNVDLKIKSGDRRYSFYTEEVLDITGKTKELVHIDFEDLSNNVEDRIIRTAFAKNLGIHWELWMAIREIYSNCLDEGGNMQVTDDEPAGDFDTCFSIEITPEIAQILEDWDFYFRTNTYIYQANRRSIYKKKSFQPYTIYKNGIRIYLEENITNNLFVYDDLMAEIDEMRVLRHLSSTEWDLCNMLRSCNDVDIINTILDNPNSYEASKLLGEARVNFSETWVKLINERYAREGEFTLGSSYKNCVQRDPRFSVGFKALLRESASYGDKYVTVKEVKTPSLTLVDKIRLHFEEENKLNFTDITIKEAICVNDSKYTVAHPRSKTLYVHPDFFDVEEDDRIDERDIEFIEEYYALQSKRQIFHDLWLITKRK